MITHYYKGMMLHKDLVRWPNNLHVNAGMKIFSEGKEKLQQNPMILNRKTWLDYERTEENKLEKNEGGVNVTLKIAINEKCPHVYYMSILLEKKMVGLKSLMKQLKEG